MLPVHLIAQLANPETEGMANEMSAVIVFVTDLSEQLA